MEEITNADIRVFLVCHRDFMELVPDLDRDMDFVYCFSLYSSIKMDRLT